MSLPSSIRFVVAAALALGAAHPSAAEGVDASVLYRCPGNDYRNTITAREAERLGCRRVEGAPVTVIQSNRARGASTGSGGSTVAAPSAASGARVDPAAQRARDTDARRILEGELRSEEGKLAEMQKEFNNGEPERHGDEKNYQKYLDRVNEMRSAIARKQTDIAALRREIQKLPPPQ